MKIMVFNTQHCKNYITKEIDFQVMADAIKKCDADIVGLNEMYGNQVGILAELTGLKHHFFARAIDIDENTSYGNGLLSKYPIISAEVIEIPDPEIKNGKRYETRCLLKATFEGGITVLVTHFGLNPDERENAVKTVLQNMENQKCIFMGDLNAIPDDEVLNPIRERMKDTADVFDKPLLSIPSDKPVKKIDYIFVTPDIEVVSADIPEIVASDHRPHTANLNF